MSASFGAVAEKAIDALLLAESEMAASETEGASHRRGSAVAIAGAAYLGLSVFVWWGLWSAGARTTCSCGDSSTFIWYIEWPAYALAHGLDPLYSAALFHPGGVNLLSNTSVVAVGIVLAPVTWLLGPVASFNVALTLSPALSALAAFVLLRRWVSWAPAAFAGGLCYGFSPFVLDYLADGHLMLGLAVVPPLVIACLDEMLIRQRHRPVVVGVLLGILLALQFFIGTEILLVTVAAAAVGVVFVVAHGMVHDVGDVRRRLPYVAASAGAGAATVVALLAYPLWFALAGPAHLSGPIWPDNVFAWGGTSLRAFFTPTPPVTGSAFGATYFRRLGGYQGPILSTHYLGVALAVVVVVGTLVWRKDRKLWLFGITGALALAVAQGFQPGVFVPWRWLSKLPQFGNIVPERFTLVTFLAAACMLGLIVDHTHGAIRARTEGERSPRGRASGAQTSAPQQSRASVGRIAPAVVAMSVAAVALVPWAVYLAPSVPMTTQPTVVPTWFRTVAPRLGPGQVLLVVPAPFSGIKGADFWQATDRMSFSMVGGPGPGAVPTRAGKERQAEAALTTVSVSADPAASLTGAQVEAVRRALGQWGVTQVVIPDQPGLPLYDLPASVTSAAVLITAATGKSPALQASAWVWKGWGRPTALPEPNSAALRRCTKGVPTYGATAMRGATACALAA